MHVGRIKDFTRILGAPDGHDKERDGPIMGLPIRDYKLQPSGMSAMMSAWFPTPEEIQRMFRGAPIYLSVVGQQHPPVQITVGEATLEGGVATLEAK